VSEAAGHRDLLNSESIEAPDAATSCNRWRWDGLGQREILQPTIAGQGTAGPKSRTDSAGRNGRPLTDSAGQRSFWSSVRLPAQRFVMSRSPSRRT
jgi:hypothetical protein